MKNSSILKWVLAALAAALLVIAFPGCNVSENDSGNIIAITLNTDATGTVSTYDSIRVDILNPDSTPFKDRAVVVKGILINDNTITFDLGKATPEAFIVVITGYKNKAVAMKVNVKFPNNQGSSGWTVIIDPKSIGTDTVKSVPTKVNIITASPLALAVNGASQRVQAEVLPSDADQAVTWTSLAPTVAAIDADGSVSPGTQGAAKIIATSQANPDLADTIEINTIIPAQADSIRIAPHDLILYLGGGTHLLTATVIPLSPLSGVVFSSSDKGIVEVAVDGRVIAKAKGDALVTAYPLGNPAITDTCRIKVVKDDPLLDVGSSRKIATGEEAAFPIKVTQKHGGIAILKWDLDGNGSWDVDSVKDSVAAPKMKYTGANTEVTALFYVRDTEGNVTTASVKVSIGSQVPLVDIIKPSKRDTLVNKSPFIVEYLADGVHKTKSVDLSEGLTPVEISESNPSGTGRDSVFITLDTKAPKVEITSPLPNTTTNNASVSVTWVVDDVPQTTQKSENLAGKQGSITISRDYFDDAGNRGSTSVVVFRDTVGPLIPTFTTATTGSPTSNTKPTWAWTGGGGGNETFRFIFNGQAEVQTQLKNFTATTLTDGNYTLSVRELDTAGNLSLPAIRTLVVQTAGPGAPTVTGNGGPTKAPQWTWTRTLPGSTFRIRLYKAGEPAAQDSAQQTTALYSPNATLLTGSNGVVWQLKVEEKDALGNWSAEGSASINVDVVAPSGATPTASQYSLGAPNFVWTSIESGAKYSYRLVRMDNSSTVSSGTISTTSYNPGNVVVDAVSYKFFLSVLDAAGNTSGENSATTLVDLNPPLVVITGPTTAGSISSANPILSGTVSDANGIMSLKYSVEGGASGNVSFSDGSWVLSNISFATGSQKVVVSATDYASQTSTAEITITKVPNVVFVRKDGNNGSGNSWQNAFKDFADGLNAAKLLGSGTEIWVADGTYSHSTRTYYQVSLNLSIIGGFSAEGTGRSLSDRDVQVSGSRKTILTNANFSMGLLTNFAFDGFNFQSVGTSIGQSTGTEIRNCTYTLPSGSRFAFYQGDAKIINTTITGFRPIGGDGVITVTDGSVEFTKATIYDNKQYYVEGPIVFKGKNSRGTFLNCMLYGNTGLGDRVQQIGFGIGGGGVIALDAASLTNLEGGICKIGYKTNGIVTDLSGTPLTCPE
ncbi:MAG: Ig-like domain-containing protein [Fibrobacterota bacterium]|nr:Ig-like domain-containing protein [Fibrobacterota bacterium]